jgi:2-(1,2-epoxy-1,2-dihydrophenyl)acetyl-CoA isomerase
MEYKVIKYNVNNGIAMLTLDRPEVFNAFDDVLSKEVIDALHQANKDDAVRVLVISGSGKAFCSGQDLKAVQAVNESGTKRSLSDSIHKRYNPMIRAMRTMPKPIIGMINGVAAGAGCSLALACDVIIASELASFIEVFINIGLVLDSGSSYFLPRLVGSNKAFELASLGSKISAAEALRLGMINEVVPHDMLEAKTMEWANRYAAAPTKAIGLMKKMLNKSHETDLDTMLDYEAYCQEIAGNSNDYKEGVLAFIEKRKANFKGN